jgi:hypothetical protein
MITFIPDMMLADDNLQGKDILVYPNDIYAAIAERLPLLAANFIIPLGLWWSDEKFELLMDRTILVKHLLS